MTTFLMILCALVSTSAYAMEELMLPLQQTSIQLSLNEEKHLMLMIQEGQKTDTYTFVHKQASTIETSDGDFYHFAQALAKSEAQYVVDLWPLNGSCNSRENRFINNLFKSTELANLTTQIALANTKTHDVPHVRLFVLDLKNSEGTYMDFEKIARFEKYIAELIASNQHQVSNLLLKNGIQFMLCEGSLKAVIIKNLCSSAVRYFHEKKGAGPRLLCILCEIIMNHFKRGNIVEIHHEGRIIAQLHPHNFFMRLTKNHDLSAYPLSIIMEYFKKISLQTYYSAYYRELYGKESVYLQLVSGSHHIEHTLDQSQNTIITLRS